MILQKDNLVAIAYKTGYCGSLVYALIAMSPEVEQFTIFNDLDFKDGTAHKVSESWFKGLHDYNDSLTVNEQDWPKYITPRAQQALQNNKLILFRCHPNTALKLSFIENLRVLYLTHKNRYIPERWAYEKVYKPQGDNFYQKDLQKLLATQKTVRLTDQIRRIQLIKNLNHHVVSWKEIQNKMVMQPYLLQVDKLLGQDFDAYLQLCIYLRITPIGQCKFENIINKYNQQQWKRF